MSLLVQMQMQVLCRADRMRGCSVRGRMDGSASRGSRKPAARGGSSSGGSSVQASRRTTHLVYAEGLLQRNARPLCRQLRRRQLQNARERAACVVGAGTLQAAAAAAQNPAGARTIALAEAAIRRRGARRERGAETSKRGTLQRVSRADSICGLLQLACRGRAE